MRKALVSPNEQVLLSNGESGSRVVEVCESTFEVAEPLFWADCGDDVVAGYWYWSNGEFKPVPVPVPVRVLTPSPSTATLSSGNIPQSVL